MNLRMNRGIAIWQKLSNLERPTEQYFDLDQISQGPSRYRGRRIRGTHDLKDVGSAYRVVSSFMCLR